MAEENKEKSLEEKDIQETTPSSVKGEGAMEKLSGFFEGNAKIITIVVGAIVVAVFGYIGYQKLFVAPKQIESAENIYLGEHYLIDTQEWHKVIAGDSVLYAGMASQAKSYDGYKGGEIAYYDMGVAYLNSGKYPEALKAFENVDFEDENLATITLGAMGDAHLELGNLTDAINHYDEAVKRRPKNDLTAPIYMMKLAGARELEGDFAAAAKLYSDVIQNFPDSPVTLNAEKYLVLANAKTSVHNLK